MLLGVSGVGKSTLINKILKVNAPTGDGNFITTQTTPYTSNAMPFLRLVDTRGIELSDNFGAQQLENEAIRFIQEQNSQNDFNNFVHCIWYCITGKRFQQVEVDILNRIRNYYQGNKIPIIIVFTQSVDKPSIERLKNYISGKIDFNDFVEILADEIIVNEEQVIKPYGVDKLIDKTLIRCKEALNGDMRSVMTRQISKVIENDIINENNRIGKYIYEKIILNFTKGYIVQNSENFIQSLATIIGYNIYYFLNKKTSNQTFSLIKNEVTLRNNVTNYINYYKQSVSSLLSNHLNNFAFKFLNIQAKKEQELGQSTLIQNKKNADDFIAGSKEFLNNNFYGFAQKYYIGNFIIKLSEYITSIFEGIFNQNTKDLLNQNEIKILIDKCFLQKYQEFEKRVASLNIKKSFHPEKLKHKNSIKDESNILISNSSSSLQENPLDDINSVITIPQKKFK